MRKQSCERSMNRSARFRRAERTKTGTDLLSEVDVDRVSESSMAVSVGVEEVSSLEDVVGSVLVYLKRMKIRQLLKDGGSL